MMTYKIELTETEIACGVTLDQVADELTKVWHKGDHVVIRSELPPALAGAVARAALGAPAEFSHINKTTGYLIYVPS